MRRIRRKQKGLTLIELLVVGTIILLVTAISLPMVKPMLESQQTNSAAQVVSTYLNRAKNRAKQTGRPCGVRFEVWPGTKDSGGASLIMRQVDVPPVYTGFTGKETVSVAGCTVSTADEYLNQKLDLETEAKIQFNSEGPFYNLNKIRISLKNQVTSPKDYVNVPFRVQFSPKPTMTPPMALPQGAVVDLKYSGVGTDDDQKFIWQNLPGNESEEDVTIMFLPSGAVDTVHGEATFEPIYLLIGRWDQIAAVRGDTDDDVEDAESLPNYADGRNFWVVINPLSGMISTTEVNPVNSTFVNPELGQIRISREFASQVKRNVGGY